MDRMRRKSGLLMLTAFGASPRGATGGLLTNR